MFYLMEFGELRRIKAAFQIINKVLMFNVRKQLSMKIVISMEKQKRNCRQMIKIIVYSNIHNFKLVIS